MNIKSILFLNFFGCLAFSLFFPLFTAPVISGDESIELNKAIFFCNSASQIQEMWNDQPFLYTCILSFFIKHFDSYIWLCRYLNLLITVLLVSIYCHTSFFRSHKYTVFTFIILFWCTPNMFAMSVSAMPEQFTFGICSIIALLIVRTNNIYRFLFFCFIFGALLNAKYTSIILLVPLLFAFIYKENSLKTFIMVLVRSFLTIAIGFTFAKFMLPHYNTVDGLNYHFAAFQTNLPGHPVDSLPLRAFYYIFSVLGVFHCFRNMEKSQNPVFIFLLTQLVIGLLIFSFHKPWWFYYDIHNAIPLAYFATQGLKTFSCSLKNLMLQPTSKSTYFSNKVLLNTNVIVGLIGLSIFFGGGYESVIRNWLIVVQSDVQDPNGIHSIMKKYPDQNYVFSEKQKYPQMSKKLVIPSLIVLSKKRLTVGGLTEEKIFLTLRNTKPDQIYLTNKTLYRFPKFSVWLNQEYSKVATDTEGYLYVHNKYNPNRLSSVLDNFKAYKHIRDLNF